VREACELSFSNEMLFSIDLTQKSLGMNLETQRKLYNEEMLMVASIEVWVSHSFDLTMQLIF